MGNLIRHETVVGSEKNLSLNILSTPNKKMENKLQQKYHFKEDRRIKTVGSVYHKALLKKIRESAYAYIHGHGSGERIRVYWNRCQVQNSIYC